MVSERRFKALKECTGKKLGVWRVIGKSKKRTATICSSNDCGGVKQRRWIQELLAGGRFSLKTTKTIDCIVRQGISKGGLQEICEELRSKVKRRWIREQAQILQ